MRNHSPLWCAALLLCAAACDDRSQPATETSQPDPLPAIDSPASEPAPVVVTPEVRVGTVAPRADADRLWAAGPLRADLLAEHAVDPARRGHRERHRRRRAARGGDALRDPVGRHVPIRSADHRRDRAQLRLPCRSSFPSRAPSSSPTTFRAPGPRTCSSTASRSPPAPSSFSRENDLERSCDEPHPRALVVLSLCSASAASADRAITVDGNDADWAGATTCMTEPAGDGAGGVDCNGACVTNDNTSGDNGKALAAPSGHRRVPHRAGRVPRLRRRPRRRWADRSGDDEVYAVVYPAATGSQFTGITLAGVDPVTYTFKRSYTSAANCGGSSTSNGWAQAKVGTRVRPPESTAASASRASAANPSLQTCTDRRRFQMGVYPAFDVSPEVFYDGTADVVYTPGTAPAAAGYPALTSRTGQNKLFWDQPRSPRRHARRAARGAVGHAGQQGVHAGQWHPLHGREHAEGRLHRRVLGRAGLRAVLHRHRPGERHALLLQGLQPQRGLHLRERRCPGHRRDLRRAPRGFAHRAGVVLLDQRHFLCQLLTFNGVGAYTSETAAR